MPHFVVEYVDRPGSEEARDRAAAMEIAHRDPYARSGVFQQTRVLAHRIQVLTPPARPGAGAVPRRRRTRSAVG